MGNNNIRGGFLRNSHPIVYEILFAACVAVANLIVLFIIYDGRHNLSCHGANTDIIGCCHRHDGIRFDLAELYLQSNASS
mmetsp:Transcript_1359/g.2686  ORF Transcript_1359/g.2686 Transcript_1359/m.2686 type:complete len:80 (+) Transcript_1359:121-360(+)